VFTLVFIFIESNSHYKLSKNSFVQLAVIFAVSYFNRGSAKYNLQDYRGAIADYNKAIQLKPDYADAYINRGVAKYSLKDKNGACLDWSKAGELGLSSAYNAIQKFCK
jgi:tetratricopeptide (TPR) repeat protein